MNVTETSAQGLKREFKVTIPARDFQSKLDLRLEPPARRGAKDRDLDSLPLPDGRHRMETAGRGDRLDAHLPEEPGGQSQKAGVIIDNEYWAWHPGIIAAGRRVGGRDIPTRGVRYPDIRCPTARR